MLFHLTYERLGTLRAQMKGLKISEEPWALALTQGWDDEMEGFATLCQLCINMVTDVFINYTSSLDIASENVSEGHKEEFDLFTVLWFSFMRLLLLYAEEATNLN